jgi:hypothetical protein
MVTCYLILVFRMQGCHGRDRIVVGFTTTCTISACSWQDVLDTTLCDKVCQWLAAGWWFSPGTLVSSTNKTDRHNITEILLKVALSTINLNQTYSECKSYDIDNSSHN